MQPKPTKKVFHTAVVIAPDQIEQIQAIRQKYDTAYERWMPHINIEFPFFEPEQFDQVYPVLQNEFKDFKSFPIRFSKIEDLKGTVMVLEPQTPDNNIHKIFNKILALYPTLNDLAKKSNEGFCPHLTLGRFTAHEMPKKKKEFQDSWKQFTYMCNEIHMIARGPDTPFEIKKTIKFAP